jgi:hypothetical protein
MTSDGTALNDVLWWVAAGSAVAWLGAVAFLVYCIRTRRAMALDRADLPPLP